MSKINCYICKDSIVKYEMDVGNTVKISEVYICDECSRNIAQQLIERD